MFTFFPLYLFFLEKIYVFIKISHCSSSENCSFAHIWKPSRWLWLLAMFLIIWNASPEPVVNPLCRTGGDSICRGGGEEEEEGEMVPKDLPSLHRGTAVILNVTVQCLGWCPELGSGSVWPLPQRTWAMAGQSPARPSAFIPAKLLGTGAPRATPPPGLLLPAAACSLKTHLEIMTEE